MSGLSHSLENVCRSQYVPITTSMSISWISLPKCGRVESLHGQALFSVHHRSAMSLSTSDFSELEENSIYFTNEFSEMHRFYIVLGVVYNMETQVLKSYYKFRGNCGKKYPPLFWIVPDPW